jgi:uncharacterized protein DUF4430
VTGRRGTAVAIALLGAALATAGCGLGPGGSVGSVELTVTREYGAVPVLRRSLDANESDTVMRLLEGSAEIETRYGGGFVHSIDGVAEGEHGGHPYDWFFYVDGVESPIGAAEVDVKDDERVWWDYRDWSATNHVPAVVGSWPAPFSDGIEGRRYPVVLRCLGPRNEACGTARRALEREGVALASGRPKQAIEVLVGRWDALRSDPAARLIDKGPAESGVYAEFQPAGLPSIVPSPGEHRQGPDAEAGLNLIALDQGGGVGRILGPDAGLLAATSLFGGPPVWVVTGGTAAAVREAADSLDAAHLRDHYAVAIEEGKTMPLPLGGP